MAERRRGELVVLTRLHQHVELAAVEVLKEVQSRCTPLARPKTTRWRAAPESQCDPQHATALLGSNAGMRKRRPGAGSVVATVQGRYRAARHPRLADAQGDRPVRPVGAADSRGCVEPVPVMPSRPAVGSVSRANRRLCQVARRCHERCAEPCRSLPAAHVRHAPCRWVSVSQRTPISRSPVFCQKQMPNATASVSNEMMRRAPVRRGGRRR